jgi:hypothetical protein
MPALFLPDKKCPNPGNSRLVTIFTHLGYADRSSLKKKLIRFYK